MIVPLNDVRGAENGAAIAVPARARPTVRVISWVDGATRRTALSGRVTCRAPPRPSSSTLPRLVPGGLLSAAGTIGSASGSRLHRCEIRLAPETPSTVAWCIFENTTILPSS